MLKKLLVGVALVGVMAAPVMSQAAIVEQRVIHHPVHVDRHHGYVQKRVVYTKHHGKHHHVYKHKKWLS